MRISRISFLLPAFFALTLVGCDKEPEQPSVPPAPPIQEEQAPMPAQSMPSEPAPAEDEYEQ